MGYIYVITNQVNGKQYVGKTVGTIEKRFKEHCRDSRKERCEKRPLYNAMNKYGTENFQVSELEFVEDNTLLSNRETFWINKLQTYGNKGYNATKGGDGAILYDHSEIIKLYNNGMLQKDIAKIYGCSCYTISNILKGSKIDGRKNKTSKAHKIIIAYDSNNSIVKEFGGSFEAADWLVVQGKSKSRHSASNHIIDCCNGKQKKCGGYIWKYKEE